MSVFYNPRTALLDHVNCANGYTTVANYRFTEDQVILSKPAPTEGTWREETTGKNTFLRISAKEDSIFKGRVVITYNRLNLGDFAKFRPRRKLPCHEPVTVHDIIPNILYYFGIFLSPEEVHDDEISLNAEGEGVATIRMKEDAIIFTGELTFDIVKGGAFLADHLVKTELDGLNYPVEDPTTEVSAILYTYPFDLSEHRDVLIDIEEGIIADADAEAIAGILPLIDHNATKGEWNADYEKDIWSLAGATVLYNGLNSLNFATNQRFKYVMQLQLREGVTTPSGVFFLHYNDPFDPDAPEQL